MEIRGARESELKQVVELNCLAFNADGRERYWQYVQGDNSYRLPQTRVVVVNDIVASSLRVWERRIRIGPSLVTLGGIGNVCTHPDYRGAGYASALMQDTISYLGTTGCDIGVLFTIIPAKFYHRLGWTSFPLHGFSVAYNSLTNAERPAGWQVTPFNAETDLDAVACLHDIANAQQGGTIARTRAYWNSAPSRIRGVLPTVVAHQNGDLGGYLNYEISAKRAEIHEVGHAPNMPTEPLDALITHLLQTCEAQQIREIIGSFSPQHPFVKRLMLKCNGQLTPTVNTTMMLYSVNLPILLRRLLLAWESNLVGTGATFPPCTVKLPTLNDQQAALHYNADGTLHILSEIPEAIDAEIALTEADFWQLLFGEIGWKHLRLETPAPPEISALLTTLFPKREVIFWTPDRY